MARRDDLHFPVRRALEKEGWAITLDPLPLTFEDMDLEADFGAERMFAAEKGGQKIAVEVKDFDSASATDELQKVMGQLRLYQWALDEGEPDRELFLAISETVYDRHFQRPSFRRAVQRSGIKRLVFNEVEEVVLQWIKPKNTLTS
jgi:XisH protein